MTATATEVKNRFGEFMDRAQIEPVTVEKTGRQYAVLIGFDEYMRLKALEDAYWGAAAAQAEASGFVGTEEASRLLSIK
jgi:prevent-host-death family protein